MPGIWADYRRAADASARALTRAERASIPEVGMSLVLELLAIAVDEAAVSSKTEVAKLRVDPTATPLE